MIHLSRRARGAYTFLLCFMAVGMPNLNLLMSMATILLLLFWFFVPGPRTGWKAFKKNRIAVLLLGLFAIHVIWLLNTSDFSYAFKDLRIKLTLAVLALVLGSVPFERRQLKLFFLALSAGVWIATLSGYVRYLNLPPDFHDYREIVQGVSHIRLSLMMVMLVAGIIYFWRELTNVWRAYSLVVIVNVLVFFNVLQSATGFMVLMVTLWFTILYVLWRKPLRYLLLFSGGSLLICGGIFGYCYMYYQEYFTPKNPNEELALYTANGRPYTHHTNLGLVENGNYIYNYINKVELDSTWNRRSDRKIVSDSSKKAIEPNLMRYLTSKGLRKDSAGIMQLSDADIRNIEHGYPNERYANSSGLYHRFHAFMFGMHVYHTTGVASGLSFFQRVVFWKTAIHIIKQHFWLGTGTGDIKQAFYDAHRELHPDLDKRYWLRSHNQFLTFFAAFGVFGFAYFLMLFGFAFYRRRWDYLTVAFLLVAFISCLTEDTIESQAGVTFFAVFFALLSKPAIISKPESRVLKAKPDHFIQGNR